MPWQQYSKNRAVKKKKMAIPQIITHKDKTEEKKKSGFQ
jgi:hypothetical protein